MTRTIQPYAFTNEYVPVDVRIDNRARCRWPGSNSARPCPDLRDSAEYRLVTSVGGRTAIDYRYRLYCRRRGYYGRTVGG